MANTKRAPRRRSDSSTPRRPDADTLPRFTAPVPDSPVVLEHPVEYGGKTYKTIIRRRPSSGVLGRWFEQFQERNELEGDPHLNVPIFVDEAGELVPDAVLGFLDDDDRQTVFEETERFFPKRLAVALELLTQELPLLSGAPSEPISSATSAAAAPSSMS